MKYLTCLFFLLCSFNLFSSENKPVSPQIQVADFLPNENVVKAIEMRRTLDKNVFMDEYSTITLWTLNISYQVVLEDNSTVTVRGRWKNSYYYDEAPWSIMKLYTGLYIQPGDAIRKSGSVWDQVYDTKDGMPRRVEVPKYKLYRDGKEIIEFTINGYFWS